MPYFDKETIEKAREVDLLTYLESCEPYELVRMGSHAYCTRSHDSLKISNGKWYWWSRSIGGSSAIDYLVQVKGMSFTQAVETIISNNLVDDAYCPPPIRSYKELELPPRHDTADNVRMYLEGRGIDEQIVSSLIHAGRIYESHYIDQRTGKKYINAVFVGVDEDGAPKYATIRGIDSDYKGEASGSDKCYSFSIPAAVPSEHLHIFEGAIDLLSYLTLMRMDGQEMLSEHFLPIGGVNLPKENREYKIPRAIEGYIERHTEAKSFYFHLNNDKAGRLGTNAIISVLPGIFDCHDEPPPSSFNDYNDYLRHCRNPTIGARGGGRKIENELVR